MVCLTTILFSTHILAGTSTFKWNEPGSVKFYTSLANKLAGKTLDDNANATDYTFSGDEVFVAPAEGYVITSMKATDGSNNVAMRTGSYQEKYGQVFNISWGSLEGKTYEIVTEKIERDGKININVVNGPEFVNAKFKEYWTPVALSKGNNEIAFSGKFEKTLVLQNVSGSSVKKFYEVKRNGNVVADGNQTPYYAYYELKNIAEGDNIEIRVFEEGKEPEIERCKITLQPVSGLEDCVKSVFDKTGGAFLTIADGAFEIEKGNEFQVNFNEDFTFTSFTYAGKDVTNLYSADNRRIVLKAEGDATLSIAGAPTVYSTVDFTVYVKNPQGVRLRLGAPYSLEEADLTGGTAIGNTIVTPTQSFTNISGITTIVPEGTMSPSDTRTFKVSVSEKSPRVFVSPLPGYYITGVWDGMLKNTIDYAEAPNLTFYVLAEPISRVGKATVKVDATDDVRLVPSPGLAQLWMNPGDSFGITKGVNNITFDPIYHTPFTFRIIPSNLDFNVDNYELYLDGVRVTPDENGNFPVELGLPAGYANGFEGKDEDYVGSTLHAYAIDAKASCSSFVVTRQNELPLDVMYSDMRRTAEDYFSIEEGTKVTLRPGKDIENYLLTLGDEIVYGVDETTGETINRLSDDGEYSFTAPKSGTFAIRIQTDPHASSSVSVIGGEEHGSVIYNLQGISVGIDFENLPAGVYIRGGKKIIKK